MPDPDPRRSLTFGALISEHARSRPDGIAVVDGPRRTTWRGLDERVDRLAAGLGLGPGDRLLWLGQNSGAAIELLLACARLGAIVCLANWRQSADELGFVLDDLDPAVVVWQGGEIAERVEQARVAFTGGARWVEDTELDSLHADGAVERDVDPDEPVLAMYTAAFEGRPAAALLSQTALLTQDLVLGRMLGVDDRSAFLVSGPMFHIATLMVVTATLHHGGTNVVTPRVDAEEIRQLVADERCSHAFLTRPTIEAIAKLQAEDPVDMSTLWEAPDPDRYRGGIIGAPGCPWNERPGGFGQTEVMGLATFAGLGAAAEGRAGRPSPAALVRIVDDEGGDVAPGDTGEIVVRGPIVINGYHNRPELTAARSRGGWHHTGDLGRREHDGSITFVGPMAHLIKSASENIYPAEVEAALVSHEAVKEACVIGVPDPTWTQRVKAVVVLAEGASASAEELIEHCRSRIASYKKPSEVVFVDSLPKLPVGFTDRAAVDAAHGGGGYPGS
jgi:acyl-CoA synthetase (AMP-forming)/AMP-acid ligase II